MLRNPIRLITLPESPLKPFSVKSLLVLITHFIVIIVIDSHLSFSSFFVPL